MSIEIREAGIDFPKMIRVKDIKKVFDVKASIKEHTRIFAAGKVQLKDGRWLLDFDCDVLEDPEKAKLSIGPPFKKGDEEWIWQTYMFDLKRRAWVPEKGYKAPSSPGYLWGVNQEDMDDLEVSKKGEIEGWGEHEDKGSEIFFKGQLLDPTTYTFNYTEHENEEFPGSYQDFVVRWGTEGKPDWEFEHVGPMEW